MSVAATPARLLLGALVGGVIPIGGQLVALVASHRPLCAASQGHLTLFA